jgi:hypothetical protein
MARHKNLLTEEFIYFFDWFYSPYGPWPLFSLLICSQTVELLGRVIISSQGLYLNTGQHRYRINTYTHQISMPWVGFEPTITVSERAKTVHALDRAAIVTSEAFINLPKIRRRVCPISIPIWKVPDSDILVHFVISFGDSPNGRSRLKNLGFLSKTVGLWSVGWYHTVRGDPCMTFHCEFNNLFTRFL